MTSEFEIRREGTDMCLKYGEGGRRGTLYGILAFLGALLGAVISGLNDGETLIIKVQK